MKILGIETSSKICSVALRDGENTDEISLDIGLVHSEKLFTIIEELLERNGIESRQLDGLAVGTGPGSFTGIRVGVSAARGIAQCLDAPLAGISSLDGLALNARGMDLEEGDIVCPVVDALRKEVYTAVYRNGPEGIERVSDYTLIKMEALLKDIGEKGRVFFTGDAVDLYEGEIKNTVKGKVAPRDYVYASALSITLAAGEILEGPGKNEYYEVLPLYIRKPEAEIKWKEREEKKK